MKITFLSLFFAISYYPTLSYAFQIPDSIYNRCNTADTIKVLSGEEKGVILYMNIARCYPEMFRDSIFVPYADSAHFHVNTRYYRTLLTDLDDSIKRSPLVFSEDLYPIAAKHSWDMGRKGLSGHGSSKGESFKQRTWEFPGCGENCSYGHKKPLDIVIQLLLDENVPSLGHRENILNPAYRQTAVSIHKHKRYGWNCTIDFLW